MNFYEILSIEQKASVNLIELEENYIKLQKITDNRLKENSVITQEASNKNHNSEEICNINKAYETLKKPLKRYQYLLELNNIDYEVTNNAEKNMQILQESMEWQLKIEEFSENKIELEKIKQELERLKKKREQDFIKLFDIDKNYQKAQEIFASLSYINRLEKIIKNKLQLLFI